ncbi:hypothetical protein LCGC14_2519250, partial [marine sediment metagenome]
WPDLPESRRQEYLATAKAVLPEIVGEAHEDCIDVIRDLNRNLPVEFFRLLEQAEKRIRALRDRRLGELKK